MIFKAKVALGRAMNQTGAARERVCSTSPDIASLISFASPSPKLLFASWWETCTYPNCSIYSPFVQFLLSCTFFHLTIYLFNHLKHLYAVSPESCSRRLMSKNNTIPSVTANTTFPFICGMIISLLHIKSITWPCLLMYKEMAARLVTDSELFLLSKILCASSTSPTTWIK